MRRLVVLGLRLLGVAIIAVILTRIQYRDLLLDPGAPEREPRRGTVEEGAGSDWFLVAGDVPERVPLPADWRTRTDVVKPGLLTNVRRCDKLLLIVCTLLFGPVQLFVIVRWWLLLDRAGQRIPPTEALRLHFIGGFFNSALPGLTGGDLVKAVYVARHAKEGRIRAFLSVYVDRIVGLLALGLLSAAVLLPKLAEPAYREAVIVVALFLGGTVVFSITFLFEPARRALRPPRRCRYSRSGSSRSADPCRPTRRDPSPHTALPWRGGSAPPRPIPATWSPATTPGASSTARDTTTRPSPSCWPPAPSTQPTR